MVVWLELHVAYHGALSSRFHQSHYFGIVMKQSHNDWLAIPRVSEYRLTLESGVIFTIQ